MSSDFGMLLGGGGWSVPQEQGRRLVPAVLWTTLLEQPVVEPLTACKYVCCSYSGCVRHFFHFWPDKKKPLIRILLSLSLVSVAGCVMRSAQNGPAIISRKGRLHLAASPVNRFLCLCVCVCVCMDKDSSVMEGSKRARLNEKLVWTLC